MNKNVEVWGICTEFLKQDDIYRIYLKDDKGTIFQISVSEYDVEAEIEVGTHYYAKGEDATEIMGQKAVFADFVDRWGRYCSHCGKHHEEGYYSENTFMYFCSEECLNAEYTEEEIQEERESEYLFWTEWYN